MSGNRMTRRPRGKKGPAGGSGGMGRRRLEGKGPTPKAEDRVYHPAHKRKLQAEAERRRAEEARHRTALRAALQLDRGHELIVGRNPVVEAVRSGIPLTRVFMSGALAGDERLGEVVRTATALGAPLVEVSRAELDRMTDGAVHQGVAIDVPPHEYAGLDDLVERAGAGPRAGRAGLTCRLIPRQNTPSKPPPGHAPRKNSPNAPADSHSPRQNSPSTAKISHFGPFSACRAKTVTLSAQALEAGRLVSRHQRRVSLTERFIFIATSCSGHRKLTLALTRRSFPPCRMAIGMLRKKYRPCSLKTGEKPHFRTCRGEEYFTAPHSISRRGGFSFTPAPSQPTSAKKLALLASISAHARRNSPSARKTPQNRPIFACWANFFAVRTRIHSSWANFFAPMGPQLPHNTCRPPCLKPMIPMRVAHCLKMKPPAPLRAPYRTRL